MMRSSFGRSSTGGRPSLAPLRVKNDGNSGIRASGNGRLSSGGGRSSIGSNRSSIGTAGGLPTNSRNSLGVRKSLIPKPPSLGGVAPINKKRRSSGYGRSYGDRGPAKDPRPTSDKGFKNRCIKELVEFLVENRYPHQISPKLLQTPTTKDFIKVFEFLYSYFVPKYKAGTKIEEEIPRLFKMIGYPYIISKNAMFAIGSPHTWPSLLAALTWLRQLVEYSLGIEVDSVMFALKDDEFGDAVPESQLLFDYMQQTYSEFLAGEDTYEALDGELAQQLRQKTLGMAGDIEHMLQEYNRLKQERERLQDQPDQLGELRHKLAGMTDDVQSFQDYLKQLNSHKIQQEMRFQEMEDEYTTAAMEMQAIEENNKRMQHIFDTQEFKPTDVERIKRGRQELQRQIDAVGKEIEEIDRQVWDAEMTLGKTQERTEAKCNEYNKVAQMLKLIPASAENAHGRDYEMRPHSTSKTDFLASIKPALIQMKKQCMDKCYEAGERKITELDSLEQVKEMASDKKEEVALLETKLKRAEEELECKKELTNREYQLLHAELETMQTDIFNLRKPSQQSAQIAAKDLKEKQKKAEQHKAELQKKEEKYCNFLMSAIKLVLNHKTEIAEHIEKRNKQAITIVHDAEKELQDMKSRSTA